MSKSHCGTKETCAPEVFKIKLCSDKGKPGNKWKPYDPLFADLWSLRVCLFKIKTKQRSFDRPIHNFRVDLGHGKEEYSFEVRDPKVLNNLKLLVQELMNPKLITRPLCDTILRHVSR